MLRNVGTGRDNPLYECELVVQQGGAPEPRIMCGDDFPSVVQLDRAARHDLLAGPGLVGSLMKVSTLLSDLDLSSISHTHEAVERAFIANLPVDVRLQADAAISRGNTVLNPLPLIIAIKEAIEHGDPSGDEVLGDEQLLRIFLSISEEVDAASSVSV